MGATEWAQKSVDVESALRMELILNFVWVLLAASMVCAWLRSNPRSGTDRRLQFVALAVLLLILFPVISVTDDLQAVQNPAETDCCQRRSHLYAPLHPISGAAAALPTTEFSGLGFPIALIAFTGLQCPRVAAHPELGRVSSRPPPAA